MLHHSPQDDQDHRACGPTQWVQPEARHPHLSLRFNPESFVRSQKPLYVPIATIQRVCLPPPPPPPSLLRLRRVRGVQVGRDFGHQVPSDITLLYPIPRVLQGVRPPLCSLGQLIWNTLRFDTCCRRKHHHCCRLTEGWRRPVGLDQGGHMDMMLQCHRLWIVMMRAVLFRLGTASHLIHSHRLIPDLLHYRRIRCSGCRRGGVMVSSILR